MTEQQFLRQIKRLLHCKADKKREIDRHLANIVEYTVDWFRMLKEKYGKAFPRKATDAARTSSFSIARRRQLNEGVK